jgi:hypothetical protein
MGATRRGDVIILSPSCFVIRVGFPRRGRPETVRTGPVAASWRSRTPERGNLESESAASHPGHPPAALSGQPRRPSRSCLTRFVPMPGADGIAPQHRNLARPLHPLCAWQGAAVCHLAIGDAGRVRLEDRWAGESLRIRPQRLIRARQPRGQIRVDSRHTPVHNHTAVVVLSTAQPLLSRRVPMA